MSGVVAIHQPNFFPWLGYFDKIRRADVFVFLDAVDYPRAGSGSMGSWVNRVRLAIQGQPHWVTCPVRRMPLGSSIRDAMIDDGQPWRAKLLRTLEANYGAAPHFTAGMTLLKPLIQAPHSCLADFNIAAIRAITAHLNLTTRFLRQSELPHAGRATDLLVSLIGAVGGDTYLAGGGAANYQEDDRFATERIRLQYQDFEARSYGDPARFLPGLSVIDYLMRDGRRLDE